MSCPRCGSQTQNVTEYVTQEEKTVYVKEYYCSKCKSSSIDFYDEQGFFKSEWIDFNV
jgi:transposase-like protein